MADTKAVDVVECAAKLVRKQLDKNKRNRLLVLGVGTAETVDSIGDVFQNKIQVNLIRLQKKKQGSRNHKLAKRDVEKDNVNVDMFFEPFLLESKSNAS